MNGPLCSRVRIQVIKAKNSAACAADRSLFSPDDLLREWNDCVVPKKCGVWRPDSAAAKIQVATSAFHFFGFGLGTMTSGSSASCNFVRLRINSSYVSPSV